MYKSGAEDSNRAYARAREIQEQIRQDSFGILVKASATRPALAVMLTRVSEFNSYWKEQLVKAGYKDTDSPAPGSAVPETK
jgi:hypothetical protein